MKQSTVVSLYKPKGITPYGLIEFFRHTHPQYQESIIGYAGRLDPLAHGVMLLMIGDATKERDKYLSLPKTYIVEALLGVETDTYDALGLLKDVHVIARPQRGKAISTLRNQINAFLSKNIGTQQQPYPPFSSKAVQGKPLHWWARNNKLAEIEIPNHEITIHNITLQKVREKATDVVADDIFQQISAVKGDFRQEEIKQAWEKLFTATNQETLQTVTIQIDCSSGTYVRSLVYEMGKALGTGAIALDLLRTRVGDYYLPLTDPLTKAHTRAIR